MFISDIWSTYNCKFAELLVIVYTTLLILLLYFCATIYSKFISFLFFFHLGGTSNLNLFLFVVLLRDLLQSPSVIFLNCFIAVTFAMRLT